MVVRVRDGCGEARSGLALYIIGLCMSEISGVHGLRMPRMMGLHKACVPIHELTAMTPKALLICQGC